MEGSVICKKKNPGNKIGSTTVVVNVKHPSFILYPRLKLERKRDKLLDAIFRYKVQLFFIFNDFFLFSEIK